jgi:hypothetical protein
LVTHTLICASETAVSPFITCRIVGALKQLQLQLSCNTRTKDLNPKVLTSVTAATEEVEIACGYGTLLTYNCTDISVTASGVAKPSTSTK